MVYVILALLSGCLVIMSMVINSQLAKRIGVFRGTLVNYSVGLICTLSVLGALNIPVKAHIQNIGKIPFWAFLGGLFGVAVVAASNIVIPKVPTVYVTLLTFTGQLLAGIVLDLVVNGSVSYGKVIGVLLIIAGMAYNSNIDRIDNQSKVI